MNPMFWEVRITWIQLKVSYAGFLIAVLNFGRGGNLLGYFGKFLKRALLPGFFHTFPDICFGNVSKGSLAIVFQQKGVFSEKF